MRMRYALNVPNFGAYADVRAMAELAHETVTLDRLSNGRLILGVGLGGEWFHEYSILGEPVDDRSHAVAVDEGLEVLAGLWSGEPFSFTGQRYTVHNARFLPTPLQSPRIPIWVAGVWPGKAPFRRAARWDGVCPIAHDHTPTPQEIHDMLAYLRPYRTSDAPFDVAVTGYTGNMPAEEAAKLLAEYADAGVTWWQEGMLWEDTLEDLRVRITMGPPSV